MIKTFFLILLLGIYFPIYSQNKSSTASSTNAPNNHSQTPQLDSFLKSETVPSLPNNTLSASPEIPSVWGPFFLLLCTMIALFYLIKYFKKRLLIKSKENSPVDFIRPIITVPVTNHVSLLIIEIAERYFLFSVSSSQMALIQEIEDLNLILKIKTIENQTGKTKNFRDILGSIFHKKNDKQKLPSPLVNDEIQSFIKKQKERLDRLNE